MLSIVFLVAAIILIVLDRFVSGYILLSLGVGFIFGALASALGMMAVVQIGTIIFGFIVMFFLIRPVLKKTGKNGKAYARSLIGKEAILVDPIDKTGIGRVKIDGIKWYAVSRYHQEIEKGAKVVIREVNGTTFTVEKINNI